ncbi:Clp protease N-terminal domain-containing protein [Nonomuraea sediminis]|uniref:Clp protease N-terminal domain-containing protein n=1 Tax=Nonomuraea sediminis TaxID=2835864 RepID=UPI001BDD5C56|nr:Clp protease N-terminal domain-containing protein [Nonomuraea sediminis]
MFERFTDRARRVVVLAQEEARTLDHNYIGTEHILLGLISEREGVAGLALEESGVEKDAVRAFIEQEVGRGSEQPAGHIPFTPRAKKVLELSLREALQLRHNYIGTEHILLGLLREGKGLACQALVHLNLSLEELRQLVIDRVGAVPRERPSPEMLFTGTSALAERLSRIEESLARIERHLGIGGRDDEAASG